MYFEEINQARRSWKKENSAEERESFFWSISAIAT